LSIKERMIESISETARSTVSDAGALPMREKSPEPFRSIDFQPLLESSPSSALLTEEEFTFVCLAWATAGESDAHNGPDLPVGRGVFCSRVSIGESSKTPCLRRFLLRTQEVGKNVHVPLNVLLSGAKVQSEVCTQLV
jgi:hypothetical protein